MTAATSTATRERPIAGQPPVRRRRFTENSPAGEVLLAYLEASTARLVALDLAVRRDKPDAVHQMRVTARGLRAVLQAYPAVFPEPDTRHLRAELKWLGEVLGAARDSEVLDGHLRSALATVPAELVLGPAQARISVHFAPVEAAARAELLEALDSQRYRELRAELRRLLDGPPLAPDAAKPAGRVLPRAVGQATRRANRRMRRARRAPGGRASDVALHEARKAAKRARYAAEAAEPALGKKRGRKAHRFVRRMKKVQSVLGDHQDAVLARSAAREIGVQAHLAGENAFSFGLLHERAHHQAIAARHRARRSWRRARKSRGWLTGS